MSQSIITLKIAILGQCVPLAKRLCWCPNPTLPEYLNSEMLFSYGRGALLNSSIAMRLRKTWIGPLTDNNRQQGQIELILEQPAREPSLVSFSISNQNHITVHGFHLGLHSWLVSGLLSPSYGTQCTVYSIQCNVCTVYSLFV